MVYSNLLIESLSDCGLCQSLIINNNRGVWWYFYLSPIHDLRFNFIEDLENDL